MTEADRSALAHEFKVLVGCLALVAIAFIGYRFGFMLGPVHEDTFAPPPLVRQIPVRCVIGVNGLRIHAQETMSRKAWFVFAQVFDRSGRLIAVADCPNIEAPVWRVERGNLQRTEFQPWSVDFSGEPGVYEVSVRVGDLTASRTIKMGGR